MAPGPHSLDDPDAPGRRGVASLSTDDDDEITPMFSALHDGGRSYQTAILTSSSPEDAKAGAARPARPPSTASQRSGSHPSRRSVGGRLSGASASAIAIAAARRSSAGSGRGRPGSNAAAAAAAHDDVDDSAASHDDGAATRNRGTGDARRRRGRANGAAARRWWHQAAEKYGSVELDNKGSVARDHLALERTFLAWLRTSLSFASIGIAITQLFRLNTTITDRSGLVPDPDVNAGMLRLRQMGKPLGATFLGIAIVVLLVGARRYFESQTWIIRGKFPASRGSVLLVTLVAVALIVVSLVVVLVVNPTQFET